MKQLMLAGQVEGPDDVATLVRAHRASSGVTQVDVAQAANVARLTVVKLENGQAPQLALATAARVVEAAGAVMVAGYAPDPADIVAAFDLGAVGEALQVIPRGREDVIIEAQYVIEPEVVAATLGSERLDLPYTKVRVMCGGVTTDGPALAVQRCGQLISLYRKAVRAAATATRDVPLAVATLGGIHALDSSGDPLQSTLLWLVRALMVGAPETETLFAANVRLLWHGYPWLCPAAGPGASFEAHDDALAALKWTGQADRYLANLTAGLPARATRWPR
ncbi:MAG: hypothetical protein LBR27_02265 [Bifidobacteriaceae bacterium]|nr:hypothetical protein [Bifidobacteriaceae bacterium]